MLAPTTRVPGPTEKGPPGRFRAEVALPILREAEAWAAPGAGGAAGSIEDRPTFCQGASSGSLETQ